MIAYLLFTDIHYKITLSMLFAGKNLYFIKENFMKENEDISFVNLFDMYLV